MGASGASADYYNLCLEGESEAVDLMQRKVLIEDGVF